MSRDSLNGDQFGISEREQAEMTGKALGGHIWDSMEEAMGGPGSFRQSVVTDAWSHAHAGWQGADVRADVDDDDYPVAHGETGGWKYRYPIGGPYVDVLGPDGNAVDALHMGYDHRGEHVAGTPQSVHQRVSEWAEEYSDDYR